MEDNKNLNKSNDEEIKGVVDGKELSDEAIKDVAGGYGGASDYPCERG